MFVDRLLASLSAQGGLVDLRIGTHWTMAVVETAGGLRTGLAATQSSYGHEFGSPSVRDAGTLLGREASELARLAKSESSTERSIGFAVVNALLDVDPTCCAERNAEELIIERGRARRVAIVGHFPFVPRVREVAAECWVLELKPGPGDLPADAAPEIIPQADVVAITGMALLNGTFEGLAALPRPDAFVVVLGPTTPLTPLLFDYGVAAVSGTILTDIPAALAAVSQGASFRQIPGRRLLTLTRSPRFSGVPHVAISGLHWR